MICLVSTCKMIIERDFMICLVSTSKICLVGLCSVFKWLSKNGTSDFLMGFENGTRILSYIYNNGKILIVVRGHS